MPTFKPPMETMRIRVWWVGSLFSMLKRVRKSITEIISPRRLIIPEKYLGARGTGVIFSGRVQGVGFRYTTAAIASRFVAAGYVQNLSDGRVRLVVEGDQAELDAFMVAIRKRMTSYIENDHIDVSEATGDLGKPTAGALEIRY